ncbi:MAG: hypothetical protein ACTSYI_14110 [Promethearchaeota archaeon]
MDSPSTEPSKKHEYSGDPEIGQFSAYAHLILASIQIMFQIFATILYCIGLSWWYSPILVIIGGGIYYTVIFFRLRKKFLRFASMGLALLSFIVLLLPSDLILPPWAIFTVVISGILIFIQNYRDTKYSMHLGR